MMQNDRGNAVDSMLCPTCKVELVMSERQNIEIDYCPRCRGVWLDRGELDKIVERSVEQERTSAPQPQAQPPEDNQREFGKHGHHRSYGKHGYRSKSWLHELFD